MPKIKMQFNNRQLLTMDQVAQHRMDGRVVMRQVDELIVDGPFLVCQENANQPVMHNGCPNGSVRYFLVDLFQGRRFNFSLMPDSTRFFEVDCELVVKEL